MNRIILECPFGHELNGTSWVDSNGNIRIIVSDCIVCAGIAESNDKDDILNLIE